jgi:ribosomal protein S18 acetylase RimI-like enzyme
MPDAPSIAVRPAQAADAPRLAALSAVLGYPVDERTMSARLARLASRPGDIVLVAEVAASEIVGWIHGAEQEFVEAERRCEILGLVVDPAHRARGAGRRLVGAVEAWARARGLAAIGVRSNVTRAESHPFYRRLGYERVKTQHAYRKRLAPAADEAVTSS